MPHGYVEPMEFAAAALGRELSECLGDVLDAIGNRGDGPQATAKALGLDKVLTSRVLSAVRSADPIGALQRLPGPEPLRRLVRAAGSRGAGGAAVTAANEAIDRFESLIRDRAGDRSALDAILSAWVPESRREFELRRKQAGFKAMSQLKGVAARCIVATAVLTPNADGRHIDVTWINGLVGLHRVRPGAVAKLATRRMQGGDKARRPTTLEGAAIEADRAPLLPEFCSSPLPDLEIRSTGEVVHYTLGGEDFGIASAVDLIFAERNTGELTRYVAREARRRAFFFAETQTPVELVQFDVLVHRDLYPGQSPALRIYDTVSEGVASPNDPTREIDRLDLLERIEPLPPGMSGMRSGDVPRYAELVRHVVDRLGVEGGSLRAFRCRIGYPIYGSQVMMTFDTVEPLAAPPLPGPGRG